VTSHTRSLSSKWFQILLALAERDLYGSAIMDEVLLRTDGEMRLWPGALYSALKDMTDNRLIVETEPPEGAPTEGGKRRFYSITPAGRDRLASEVERMASLVRIARARNVGPEREAV
jgi:DNA-binding PadR family transcriptional regulator